MRRGWYLVGSYGIAHYFPCDDNISMCRATWTERYPVGLGKRYAKCRACKERRAESIARGREK